MRRWVYSPHSGGVRIPPAVQQRTEQRIRAYAERHYSGKFTRLDIRFRGAFCYIDAFTEPPSPCICADCDISRMKIRGPLRFTRIAMKSMNRPSSIPATTAEHPKKGSRRARSICETSHDDR